MQVEVSNGELLDKFTILEIKKEKGLNVDDEMKVLSASVESLTEQFPHITFLSKVLKEINSQLWVIEDTKREHEAKKLFNESFIGFSRLVYMLNDERARVKKNIDHLSNSAITEMKNHK